MNSKTIGAPTLLVALLLSSTAAAQAGGVAPPTSQTRSMKIDAKIAVDHNSNISGTSPAFAVLRSLSPSDTTYSPSLDVNISALIGRQMVFLAGSAGYRFYDRNTRLDSEQIDLSGGIASQFGPCGTVVGGGYGRGRGEVGGVQLVTTVENLREVERVNLSISCRTPTGLGAMLGGSGTRINNSQAQLRESDSESTTITAGVSYGNPRAGTVTVFGDYTLTNYPKRILAGIDGFDTRGVGIRGDRRIGGRIQSSASVGYSETIPRNAPASSTAGTTGDKFRGLTYQAVLTYKASSRLAIKGSLDRAVLPSNIINGVFQVQTGYSLSADYKLGSRIGFEIGGDRNDVRVGSGPTGIGAAPILTDSRSTRVFGSIRYKQSRRLGFSLDLENERRTSDLSEFNFTNRRIALSATASF